MTITLDVPPEKEAELKARAAASGQKLEEYALAALLPDSPAPPPYDPAAAIALLDAFANSDEYGTAEEQRETLEYLARVIDEDRPGQRSIFGAGFNPPADLNGWVEP